jgi:hypothetical protein
MTFGLRADRDWLPPDRVFGRGPLTGLLSLLREHGEKARATVKGLSPEAREERRRKAAKHPTKRPQKSKIFFIITGLIAFSDGMFVYVNYRADQATLTETIAEEGRTLANAFRVIVSNEVKDLERVASEIAKEEEVQSAMLEAYHLRLAGGDDSALQEIRDRLFILSGRFLQDEIHYHIGPELVSLLRFHREGMYGDATAASRPIVRASYNSNLSQSGFEVGGTLSGLRAATPVRVFDPQANGFVRVGTVEAISQIYPVVASFSEQLGGGSAPCRACPRPADAAGDQHALYANRVPRRVGLRGGVGLRYA